MSQRALPTADVSNSGGWTPSSGSSLYAQLDQDNTSDYVQSPADPDWKEFVVRLGDLKVPEGDGDYVFTVRLKKTGPDAAPVLLSLLGRDGTLIAARVVAAPTTSFVDYSCVLTPGEVGNFKGDYSGLQVRISAGVPVGAMGYALTGTLDWSVTGHPDLDLYVRNQTDAATCYYLTPSAGGLALNHDAFPECDTSPLPPEHITGAFTTPKAFSVWYNQYSPCASQTAPTTDSVSVQNTGGSVLVVANAIVKPGETITITGLAYGGYATGAIPNFSAGTPVVVTAVPPA